MTVKINNRKLWLGLIIAVGAMIMLFSLNGKITEEQQKGTWKPVSLSCWSVTMKVLKPLSLQAGDILGKQVRGDDSSYKWRK